MVSRPNCHSTLVMHTCQLDKTGFQSQTRGLAESPILLCSPGIHPPHIRECGAGRTMGLLLTASGMAQPGFPGALTWEGPVQGLTVAAAETCFLRPSHTRPGLRCGRLTYLCKLTQCVLQHFHSENESPLGQDLAVSISQVFPVVTRGQKEWDRVRNHIVQLGGEPALTPGALGNTVTYSYSTSL